MFGLQHNIFQSYNFNAYDKKTTTLNERAYFKIF